MPVPKLCSDNSSDEAPRDKAVSATDVISCHHKRTPQILQTFFLHPHKGTAMVGCYWVPNRCCDIDEQPTC